MAQIKNPNTKGGNGVVRVHDLKTWTNYFLPKFFEGSYTSFYDVVDLIDLEENKFIISERFIFVDHSEMLSKLGSKTAYVAIQDKATGQIALCHYNLIGDELVSGPMVKAKHCWGQAPWFAAKGSCGNVCFDPQGRKIWVSDPQAHLLDENGELKTFWQKDFNMDLKDDPEYIKFANIELEELEEVPMSPEEEKSWLEFHESLKSDTVEATPTVEEVEMDVDVDEDLKAYAEWAKGGVV